MSDRHIDIEELSAYIDGESSSREHIARHLRHCPECAKKQMQLLKLSAHIGALPGPAENPALLERVLAEAGRIAANEGGARGHVVPFRVTPRWALSTAAAAAILVVVFAGDWNLRNYTPTPTKPAPAQIPPSAESAAPATGNEGNEYDGLVHLLAETVGMEDDAPADDEPDVYAMIEGLEPGESDVFEDLLNHYANEG